MQALILDERVVSLIASGLSRVETYGGEYSDITCGISMGSPLSLLLVAIALKPLDDAMEKRDIFYTRYVDDWCIMAKSKFKLRHAIKKMRWVLEQLRLKTHPFAVTTGFVNSTGIACPIPFSLVFKAACTIAALGGLA